MTIKILNLYSGLGGNRKLWSGDIEVTAIENVPEIAKIYQDFFPNDKVIIADAHQYLLEHYKEFDFIWSSPPCPSHSGVSFFLNAQGVIRYPDMALWQEIIFLKHFCKVPFVVENVKSYYEPFVKPTLIDRHYFWSNFEISTWKNTKKKGFNITLLNTRASTRREQEVVLNDLQQYHRFDLSNYKIKDKRRLLANCVYPELGLHIFKMAFKEKQNTLEELKSQVEKK
jgi:DNA (cytosine-5)-methyltransferase 1